MERAMDLPSSVRNKIEVNMEHTAKVFIPHLIMLTTP